MQRIMFIVVKDFVYAFCATIVIMSIVLSGMMSGMTATPLKVDDFFEAIKKNPAKACIMITENNEYAFTFRPFSSATALEYAVSCYRERSHEPSYDVLFDVLAERHVTCNLKNPLKAFDIQEIKKIIEGSLPENQTLCSHLKRSVQKYEFIVEKYNLLNSAQEKTLEVSDEEFFSAFDKGNKKKLITFFDNYPGWFDKVHKSKNSTLHFVFKNFSDIPEDFILIEKLVQYEPQNIVSKNNADQDIFSLIHNFDSSEIKKKLYTCLRASLKLCWIGRVLKGAFIKAMEDKNYSVIIAMLGKNPELINEIDPKQAKTITYYLNNPPINLSDSDMVALKRLRSFVSLCAPDLKEVELPVLRRGRATGRSSTLTLEETGIKDLQKKHKGNNDTIETLWVKSDKMVPKIEGV